MSGKVSFYLLVRTWESEPGKEDLLLVKRDGPVDHSVMHSIKMSEQAAEEVVKFLRGLGVRVEREESPL